MLAPDSPIQKEIARIASTETDSVKQIKAALQLVQDRIRYVYIGLNGGNFMPAAADETWTRRFGDCKAKTALLLAVLRGLGIRGEAVLVNSLGGDGINERLPTPFVFDHVLVRVNLGKQTYWLDGTRLGDRTLDPPLALRWVLPLRSGGGDLEGYRLSDRDCRTTSLSWMWTRAGALTRKRRSSCNKSCAATGRCGPAPR